MSPLWQKRATGPTRHGDPNVAIASYLEELRQAEVAGAPTPAAALNGLGDAHLDKGDPGSAVDYYRQAAEVYEREGMHDNAIACCRKIRRYAPEDEEVGLMLGRYFAAKGLRADAIVELEAYADRRSKAGRRRETIEALREILRLDPQRSGRREQLARALTEDGQGEEAKSEYKAAIDRYRGEGDLPGLERVRSALATLEAPSPPSESPAALEPGPAAAPSSPPGPRFAAPLPIPPAAPPRGHATPPRELELEPTSYDDAPAAAVPALEPPEFGVAGGPPSAASAPAAPAPDEPALPAPKPGTAEQAMALGEGHAAGGRVEPAARHFAAAALGFRATSRWSEAIGAYRRLAQLDRATPDDFAAWAECARQAGQAPKVLEALAATARWNLARDDRPGARRAAEEMLLLDPNSTIATDILERVGTSLPRG